MGWDTANKLAEEDREARLPQWAREKIEAGRGTLREASYWHEELEKARKENDELRRHLAEGITKPGSDTWIVPRPGAASVYAEEQYPLGLGTGEDIDFGLDVEDPDFTVSYADGALQVRSSSRMSIQVGETPWELLINRI